MDVFKFLFLLSSCIFVSAEKTHVQERLFLSSLGLSSRPRASIHGPVPSALWNMYKQAERKRVHASDACTVPEYGVRGNIVRYVMDQGESSCH